MNSVTERRWTHCGLRCAVHRNSLPESTFQAYSNGWRCGYVEIPASHPLLAGLPPHTGTTDEQRAVRQEMVDRCDAALAVHGGVTWAAPLLSREETPDGSWWIGWDANHYWDEEHPWTESEAVAETERLAMQLSDLMAPGLPEPLVASR